VSAPLQHSTMRSPRHTFRPHTGFSMSTHLSRLHLFRRLHLFFNPSMSHHRAYLSCRNLAPRRSTNPASSRTNPRALSPRSALSSSLINSKTSPPHLDFHSLSKKHPKLNTLPLFSAFCVFGMSNLSPNPPSKIPSRKRTSIPSWND
jgi:hypothetical protein